MQYVNGGRNWPSNNSTIIKSSYFWFYMFHIPCINQIIKLLKRPTTALQCINVILLHDDLQGGKNKNKITIIMCWNHSTDKKFRWLLVPFISFLNNLDPNSLHASSMYIIYSTILLLSSNILYLPIQYIFN
jgi:hypothetical protein